MKGMALKCNFDHICIGVRSLSHIGPFVKKIGGKPFEGGLALSFIGCQWKFSNGGVLESLEPYGEDSFLHRFLDKHGPSVHHVTFKVPDIFEARKAAESFGYNIVGFNDDDENWKEFFLFPKESLGVVVQFAQARKLVDVESGWNSKFDFNSISGNAPSKSLDTSLLGLRMACTSADLAIKQWGQLIGGKYETLSQGRSLKFTFPNSPMYILVDVNEKFNGPKWVELLSESKLDLSMPTNSEFVKQFSQVQKEKGKL